MTSEQPCRCVKFTFSVPLATKYDYHTAIDYANKIGLANAMSAAAHDRTVALITLILRASCGECSNDEECAHGVPIRDTQMTQMVDHLRGFENVAMERMFVPPQYEALASKWQEEHREENEDDEGEEEDEGEEDEGEEDEDEGDEDEEDDSQTEDETPKRRNTRKTSVTRPDRNFTCPNNKDTTTNPIERSPPKPTPFLAESKIVEPKQDTTSSSVEKKVVVLTETKNDDNSKTRAVGDVLATTIHVVVAQEASSNPLSCNNSNNNSDGEGEEDEEENEGDREKENEEEEHLSKTKQEAKRGSGTEQDENEDGENGEEEEDTHPMLASRASSRERSTQDKSADEGDEEDEGDDDGDDDDEAGQSHTNDDQDQETN